MSDGKQNVGDAGTALHTSAWLVWRDAVCGDTDSVDPEEYVAERSRWLFHWLKGDETPPTDYCACYEQVCDFSMEVGELGTPNMTRDIVRKLETMDSQEGYDNRISKLTAEFKLPDTEESRICAERIYAATVCFSEYQKIFSAEITRAMKKGEPLANRQYSNVTGSIAALYNNVLQEAENVRPATELKEDPAPEKEVSPAYRKAEMRRKSTRKNLTDLQKSMILMHKEEMDPSHGSRSARRKRRRREKKGRGATTSKPKTKWTRKRFASLTPRRRKKHERAASEAAGQQSVRRLRGFNLNESPRDLTAAAVTTAPDEDEPDDDNNASSSQGEEDEEEPPRDDAFFRHMAQHFVRKVWLYLKANGTARGMTHFLGAYSFPRHTILTSEDMRIDEVSRGLGSCSERNFIRQMIAKVCRDDAVNEEIASIRERMIDSRPWNSACDQHTMMAALFMRCGNEFHEKYGYLARQHASRLNDVGHCDELCDLHFATARAFEEFDESVADLRYEYLNIDGPSGGSGVLRSRSESRVSSARTPWKSEQTEGDELSESK